MQPRPANSYAKASNTEDSPLSLRSTASWTSPADSQSAGPCDTTGPVSPGVIQGGRRFPRHLTPGFSLSLPLLPILSLVAGLHEAAAVTPISEAIATYQIATSSSYTEASQTYNYGVEPSAGANKDLIVTAFEIDLGLGDGLQTFGITSFADRINIVRQNNVNVTTDKQLLFYEDGGSAAPVYNLRPSFVNTMTEALLNETINRGTDNVFSNRGGTNINNIERLDFIVDAGITVPADTVGDGFVIMERGGNDDFKIAAILSLDSNGDPDAFGPIVSIESTTDWGLTQWSFVTQVLASTTPADNLVRTDTTPTQSIGGVYISYADLGASADDVIYGYSIAGGDVSNISADWVDTSVEANFPRNTSSASNDAGGLDLVAGGSISSRNPFADLAITKTVSDPTPTTGDTITFTLTAFNFGPFSAINTVVADLLPSGYTFVSSTASQGSYNSGTGIWTLGNKSVGSPQTLEIVATVNAAGNYLNTASISSEAFDPNTGNNSSSASTVPSVPPSNLVITKTSDVVGSANHGDTITYTIEVENTGGTAVGGVDVVDLLPEGVTYVPSSVNASLNPPASAGGTFTQTITTTDAGTFTVPANVTELLVEAWGGGGSGAASGTNNGGGAGGGGAYARLNALSVNPGDSINYFVGAGGGAPGAGNPGNPGQASWFGNTSTLIAQPGGGGGVGGITNGGAGGNAGTSIGNQTYAGGAGGAGATGGPPSERAGGGGGGSAFDNAAGGAGQAGARNAPGNGGTGQGNGGNGGQKAVIAGQGGFIPGGGGGGCGGAGAGLGARGEIVITYTIPSLVGTSGPPPNLASGWTIEPGSVLTITFDVILDSDAVVTELTNIVTFTSDDDPSPIGDSVTDPVNFATIQSFVWVDLNGNGLQDVGEVGRSGVTANLLDSNGDPVLDAQGDPVTTVTDINGLATFAGLTPGTYAVEFVLTSTFVFTEQDADGLGVNGTVNSDADPTTGITPTVTVSGGQTFTALDAGIYRPASISGTIRIDTTGNNVGNSPQAGVLVELLDGNGAPVLDGSNNPITTTTLANGTYSFTGLTPGTYQLRQTPPSGYIAVDDVDGGNLAIIGDQTLISLVSNSTLQFQDFVNSQFGALTDLEFCLDLDSSVGGGFTRPDDLPNNLTFLIEYASALGNPTTWSGSVELDSNNSSVTDNGNGTETVTIDDLPTLTGLTSGSGFVRLRVELDINADNTPEDVTNSAVSGWLESSFGNECRSFNNPFVSCPSLRATVTGIAGSVLTLDADAEVLNPGTAYYLEVTSGAYEGHRFDVASVLENTLTLTSDADLCAPTAPFNTLIGAPDNTLIGGDIVLRTHRTLDTLFPTDLFLASNDAGTADQVTLFDGSGNVCYWLYDDAGTPRWVQAGDSNLLDQGSLVVPPGHGVWMTSRSNKTLTSYGQVRENDFRRPLCAGFNAVTGGYPINQSAVGREYSLANSFTGNADYVQADQFLIWNGDNIPGRLGYQTHYLSSFYNPERWIKAADVFRTDVKNQSLFIRDRAAFLDLQQALPNYINQAPWAP